MRTATALTLGQAAKETGQSKPTILRAIQSGRLSATKDEVGQWAIEPAELFRVYPRQADGEPLLATGDNPLLAPLRETLDNPRDTGGATVDPALIAALREQIADLKSDRERERKIADELRAELARGSEERARLIATIEGQTKQVALLTDERAKLATPPRQRGFLDWLLGRPA